MPKSWIQNFKLQTQLQKLQSRNILTSNTTINELLPAVAWYSKTIKMKKVIMLTLLLSFVTVSFCQQTNEAKKSSIKKFYLQAGAGATSANGASIDIGLQAILKSNWTVGISYKILEMDPKNLPANYEPGVTFLIFFPVYDDMPANDLGVFSLTAGKYFETGRKTWFTAEAGLSFVNGQQFKFTSQPVISEIFYVSSNYSFQEEDKTGFGGMLKADFNWAVLPYVGLGAGAFVDFNSVQTAAGFEVKLLLGGLNTKRKH